MAEKIITRAQARALALKRYFTGTQCKRGHITERSTKNGSCLECNRQDKAARYDDNPQKYQTLTREYYASNKEDVRARRNAEYAAEPNKGRIRARVYRQNLDPRTVKDRRKALYAKHRESSLEAARVYRIKHPQKTKEQAARYNRSDRGKIVRGLWKKANNEALNRRERDRRASNPGPRRESYRKWACKEEAQAVIIANAHRRRARLLAAPGKHTAADLAEILNAQGHRCAYCRADLKQRKKHVDHIKPLARGGSNGRANLQYLCQPCNQTKNWKDPIDFARSIGLLI